MEAVLLVYRLPPKTPALVVNKFCQAFYGQDTSSWGGRYRYRRAGLLDGIPHRRIGRGVLIARRQDRGTIIRFLRSWKAVVEARVVKSTAADLRALRLAGH